MEIYLLKSFEHESISLSVDKPPRVELFLRDHPVQVEEHRAIEIPKVPENPQVRDKNYTVRQPFKTLIMGKNLIVYSVITKGDYTPHATPDASSYEDVKLITYVYSYDSKNGTIGDLPLAECNEIQLSTYWGEGCELKRVGNTSVVIELMQIDKQNGKNFSEFILMSWNEAKKALCPSKMKENEDNFLSIDTYRCSFKCIKWVHSVNYTNKLFGILLAYFNLSVRYYFIIAVTPSKLWVCSEGTESQMIKNKLSIDPEQIPGFIEGQNRLNFINLSTIQPANLSGMNVLAVCPILALSLINILWDFAFRNVKPLRQGVLRIKLLWITAKTNLSLRKPPIRLEC